MLLCHSSCLWQFASVSSQRGAHTPLCPCGPPSATPLPCHPWLSLSQQSSPSPPPFTTPLYIWSSSLISASPCVETWPCAGAHCVDVCVSTVQQRREPARNPITRRNAILQSCQTGCLRTTGPADTVRVLKLSPAQGTTVQITAPGKPPGYCKDRSTARWLSVSCPTRCRATSSRIANAAKHNSQWDYWPGDADKEKTQGGEKGKWISKRKWIVSSLKTENFSNASNIASNIYYCQIHYRRIYEPNSNNANTDVCFTRSNNLNIWLPFMRKRRLWRQDLVLKLFSTNGHLCIIYRSSTVFNNVLERLVFISACYKLKERGGCCLCRPGQKKKKPVSSFPRIILMF